jgi:hypothetical protein
MLGLLLAVGVAVAAVPITVLAAVVVVTHKALLCRVRRVGQVLSLLVVLPVAVVFLAVSWQGLAALVVLVLLVIAAPPVTSRLGLVVRAGQQVVQLSG